MPRRPAPASVPVAARLPAPLHAAVLDAAARAGTTPGGWMRDTVADRLGMALAPRPRSTPRRRHHPPPERQLALRAAVAELGRLGVAVTEDGTDPALAAEVRAVLALVVAAVAPSR